MLTDNHARVTQMRWGFTSPRPAEAILEAPFKRSIALVVDSAGFAATVAVVPVVSGGCRAGRVTSKPPAQDLVRDCFDHALRRSIAAES